MLVLYMRFVSFMAPFASSACVYSFHIKYQDISDQGQIVFARVENGRESDSAKDASSPKTYRCRQRRTQQRNAKQPSSTCSFDSEKALPSIHDWHTR
jgi:hypothetical protein